MQTSPCGREGEHQADNPVHDAQHVTPSLGWLATEQQNPASANLDELDSFEIVQLMNREDAAIAEAVKAALGPVAVLVDRVVDCFSKDGRLFYVGAGTSGRLGSLDAAECPPTFGADPDRVQCLMAGGPGAWLNAVEGAEDSEYAGAKAVSDAGICPSDVVVGIAASGRTPFVLGAIHEARRRGCFTAAIANVSGSLIGSAADLTIEAPVGPEVLTGSTRLKAGTAQKMILNMITTASMVRSGKAYGNLMVDVRATNAKLRDRALRMVVQGAGVDSGRAATLLEAGGGSSKLAILMALRRCSKEDAEQLLQANRGMLRNAARDGSTRMVPSGVSQ